MPGYTTTGFLRDLGAYVRDDLGDGERLTKSFDAATKRSPAGTTFLSYSSKDEDLIPIVVRILENNGATVYVDKKDPSLLGRPPREIATTLRSRIKQTKKLVMFATAASKESRWVPWELGIADGHRDAAGVAIFPAVDTASDYQWAEREYLGAYDRIVFGGIEGFDRDVWMVWNEAMNTAITLSKWLTN